MGSRAIDLPLEKGIHGVEISQVITTPRKDSVRVVRLSRRSAILVGDSRDDLQIVVSADGDGLSAVAKGFWGELWDFGKAVVGAGLDVVLGGGGGQNCTTTTRQHATFDNNGNMTGFTNETTTTCSPA
jgi:hypothetical protein